jgi:hypothetical protein
VVLGVVVLGVEAVMRSPENPTTKTKILKNSPTNRERRNLERKGMVSLEVIKK